jgi:hypothetical protein
VADNTGQMFGRRVRLSVGLPHGSFSDTDPLQNGLVIECGDGDERGNRIAGKVVKTSGKEPNTTEVDVYNLGPHTRAALSAYGKGAQTLIEVGYQKTGLSRLAACDVRTVDHVRDGGDWKTVLKCGDGERAARFARANESFAGPIIVGDVVTYLVKQMGLALGNSADQASKLSTKLDHGWVVHGAASAELDRVLRAVKYRYSVQDGEVQILGPGESVAQTIPDVSPSSGLIESPEMGTPEKTGEPGHLKFKALLMPAARPGGRVRLTSERYDKVILRTKKVSHDFDTWEKVWYSNFESTQDSSVKAA